MSGMLDRKGRTWHVFERDGGSITVYYTLPHESIHYVVWDSLDIVDRPAELAKLESDYTAAIKANVEVAKLNVDLQEQLAALRARVTELEATVADRFRYEHRNEELA